MRSVGPCELSNFTAADQRKRKREAATAIADRDAAVAELRETKRRVQEMERRAKVVTMQAEPKGKRIAWKFSSAFRVFERDSHLVKKMIGRGSRTRGIRRWSEYMVLSGRRCL